MDKRWSKLTPEQKHVRMKCVLKCRKNRQRRLKELAGGRCILCGYNRCFRALEFHHLNPSQKSFGIAANGHTRAFTIQLAETKKCVLLCANCHREVEDGLISVIGTPQQPGVAE